MAPDQWRLGLLVAVVLAHLLVTYLLVRRRARASAPRGSEGGTAASGDGVNADVVECPTCGAENERGYRFCRQCVEELPGSAGVARRRRRPLEGPMR